MAFIKEKTEIPLTVRTRLCDGLIEETRDEKVAISDRTSGDFGRVEIWMTPFPSGDLSVQRLSKHGSQLKGDSHSLEVKLWFWFERHVDAHRKYQ
jgi:hypothetical protein